MQALTLMNGMAFVEAAAGLADRVLNDRPEATVAQRVDYAFRRTLARRPRADEAAHLVAAFHEQREHLRGEPGKVRALLREVKAVPLSPSADPLELAAWMHIATILLNLDETITKG